MKILSGLLVVMTIAIQGNCQLTLTGQLRTRTEWRNGQATLLSKEAKPAFFTSQRTRINLGYSMHRLKFFIVGQDARVWGQDESTTNRTTNASTNGLMLHEAWAEIALIDTSSVIDKLSLKIGRQELDYDDSRLLGNLDWLQQARRHDAALIKFSDGNWQVDAGFAFNQNGEFQSGTTYNGVPPSGTYPAGTNGIGTLYKSMQFLYLKRQIKSGYISFLVLKDDFNKYVLDTASNKIWTTGVWSRYTSGFNASAILFKNFSVYASGFMQKGKNKDGADLSASFLALQTSYKASGKLSLILGGEWLSGNDGNSSTTTDERFDPLYGTPHKFWGYIDYFYVASSFGRGGLTNYFFKVKFQPGEKLTANADFHEFYSSGEIADGSGGTRDKRLGTEVDFTLQYGMTKMVTIITGYSAMFATSTLASPQVKNVSNASLNASWAYLMINIKPDFLAK